MNVSQFPGVTEIFDLSRRNPVCNQNRSRWDGHLTKWNTKFASSIDSLQFSITNHWSNINQLRCNCCIYLLQCLWQLSPPHCCCFDTLKGNVIATVIPGGQPPGRRKQVNSKPVVNSGMLTITTEAIPKTLTSKPPLLTRKMRTRKSEQNANS